MSEAMRLRDVVRVVNAGYVPIGQPANADLSVRVEPANDRELSVRTEIKLWSATIIPNSQRDRAEDYARRDHERRLHRMLYAEGLSMLDAAIDAVRYDDRQEAARRLMGLRSMMRGDE